VLLCQNTVHHEISALQLKLKGTKIGETLSEMGLKTCLLKRMAEVYMHGTGEEHLFGIGET
jgi:hypothetical protein